MSTLPVVEKLNSRHAINTFDCGQPALNRFLQRFALQSQLSGASQTYVAIGANVVLGYYTLVFGQVEYEHSPDRIRKGLARHPVPIMLLARLAVSTSWQGKRLGSGLLRDAMLRTLQASEFAGIRALMVHAKDESAREFYQHFNFEPSPVERLHLFLLLKDVRAYLGGPG